ncbi:MAG: HAMP domain-containing protein, partial [Magnetococcales bacterium]|nr:HAMP domain-containing protein [Magnetococcales bacterium]
MKIRTKLLFALISIALFVATMSAIVIHANNVVEQEIKHLSSLNAITLTHTTDVVMMAGNIHSNIRKILAEIMMEAARRTGSEPSTTTNPPNEPQAAIVIIREELDKLGQVMFLWEDTIRLWRSQEPTESFQQEEIHELAEAVTAITNITNQFIQEAPWSVRVTPKNKQDFIAQYQFFNREMEPLFTTVQNRSTKLYATTRAEMSSRIYTVKQTIKNRTQLGFALTASALLMALFLAYILSRRIATPIERLRDAAISVGSTGKFKMDMPLKSRDEIGQ